MLKQETVDKIAERVVDAAKAKAKAEGRAAIFGEGKVELDGRKVDAVELRKLIETASVSKEAREIARVSDNFAMTKKWLRAMGAQLNGNPSAMVEVQNELRGMAESTNSGNDGGHLVPQEWAALVMQKKSPISKMRAFARVIPVTSNIFNVPTDNANVTASWEAEANATTPVSPTLTKPQLTPFKLKVLTKVSMELLADANINVIDYLAAQQARIMAYEEDKQFFIGDGSSKPTGLNQASVSSIAQAGASLAYTDLTKLLMALPEQYRVNACFVMAPSIVALLIGLVDSQNRPIYTPSYEQGKPSMLFGRPLLEVKDFPVNLGAHSNASEIWLADLSYYVIADRMDLQSFLSQERYFDSDEWALKTISRVDGKFTLTEAAYKLTGVK